jgi:hypothetical protein
MLRQKYEGSGITTAIQTQDFTKQLSCTIQTAVTTFIWVILFGHNSGQLTRVVQWTQLALKHQVVKCFACLSNPASGQT